MRDDLRAFDLLKDYPEYLDKLTRKIFDVNEGSILNRSESGKGVLGRLNRFSRLGRQRQYFKKINQGFRRHQGERIILAEGDSWFEFPVFVTDIIDWLTKNKNYAIFSFASAGDWLSNMINTKEYIENLPIHTPDVFLISGGGNDLVGENRITTMICA